MAKTKEDDKKEEETTPEQTLPVEEASVEKVKKCGIIMPISGDENYSATHWAEVYDIICEAFEDTEFTPELVSRKDSVGLIHESIVTNIYSNEIVICDVSSRNPNVMFELGLRLAFDKPVIIIKDERTPYSFDTGPIEHLSYPSSLRFRDMVRFKKELQEKALATYNYAAKNPDFSPYLKSFNKAIVPGKIENVEVSGLQFLVDKINEITSDIEVIRNSVTGNKHIITNSPITVDAESLASYKYQNGIPVQRITISYQNTVLKPFIKQNLVLLKDIHDRLISKKALSNTNFVNELREALYSDKTLSLDDGNLLKDAVFIYLGTIKV